MPFRSSIYKDRVGSTEYAKTPFQDDLEEDVVDMDDEQDLVPEIPAVAAEGISDEFDKSADPRMSVVLQKYKDLILANALPTVSLADWEKGVDDSRIRMEQARRIARENLARRANP